MAEITHCAVKAILKKACHPEESNIGCTAPAKMKIYYDQLLLPHIKIDVDKLQLLFCFLCVGRKVRQLCTEQNLTINMSADVGI